MTFRNESIIGIVAIVVLHLIVFGFLMRESWVEGAINYNRATLETAVGEDEAATAMKRAEEWFRSAFVDSGVIDSSYYLFVPTKEERRRDWMLRDVAEPQFSFAESRLRALWGTIYLAFTRVSSALVWWPYLGFVIAPLFVDAWVRRRIRMSSFGFSSPVRHSWLRYSAFALVYAATVGVLVPFQISALSAPVFFLVCGALASVGFANYAKYA